MRRLRQAVRFLRILLAARSIQDFLWNGAPGQSQRPESFESYRDALDQRVARLYSLNSSNPSWRIEARKRLLQIATIAVALMEYLDQENR